MNRLKTCTQWKLLSVGIRAVSSNVVSGCSVPGLAIALAVPGQLQESIEFVLVNAAASMSPISPHTLFILHDKLETDTVVAPADHPRVFGNRVLYRRISGICQCHSYLGAREPAFLGDHVESGQADIPNLMFDWGSTGKEMSTEGRESLPR